METNPLAQDSSGSGPVPAANILLGCLHHYARFKGVGFGAGDGTLIVNVLIGIWRNLELPDLLHAGLSSTCSCSRSGIQSAHFSGA
jgi:hypothetical protein